MTRPFASLAMGASGNGVHRPHPGVEIADRQPDRNRRAVRLAGHVHDPAHASRDQVEPASPPPASGLTRRVSALAFNGARQIL